jgi:branched-chain amino acid transport system substrate-binding protein
MKENFTHKLVSLGVVVVLLLLAAGCGPTPAPTSPPAPTATPEAMAPTDTPQAAAPTDTPAAAEPGQTVKIGVLHPTTGSFAVFGEQLNNGMKLYFDTVDNQVAGANIEMILADSGGDPQQALEQARRLAEQEGVDVLVGIVNSAVVVPLAQYAGEAEVPFIFGVGGARAATGPERNPYVFRTGMANGQQDRPLGWYAATELGLTKGALLVWDFLVGEERGANFAQTFTEAGGTMVADIRPPLTTTDYGPFISQLDKDNTDIVYLFMAGPGAIAVVQQMREFGLTPDITLAGPDFLTVGTLQAMGAAAEGTVQGAQYVPVLDTPENKAFLELSAAKLGGEPSVYVEEGYVLALAVAKAVEGVGGDVSDKQKFVEAIGSVEFTGPAGPLRFDENGQSVRNVYITRVVLQADGTPTYEVLSTVEDVSQDWMP